MSYIEDFWVQATSEHVTRVMNGVTVEARFRDEESQRWQSGFRLGGWMKCKTHPWLDGDASTWTFCQVYAPPQWFIDKPDPGEGYRLLEKFPDEALHPDDEVFDLRGDGEWEPSFNVQIGLGQAEGIWYRRKIEPPKPEPKYAVGQRVKIVGPPIKGEGPIYNWTKEMDQYIGVVGAVRLKPTQDPEGAFYVVEEVFQWSFREDYLEPVEPKHYVLQVGDKAEFPNWFTVEALENGILIK